MEMNEPVCRFRERNMNQLKKLLLLIPVLLLGLLFLVFRPANPVPDPQPDPIVDPTPEPAGVLDENGV